jgi:hypothetical protein
MRSVTEFPNFKLVQGLNARNALTTEGKTPEEVAASLGATFKLEGDKLKYFLNAVEVAGQNLEGLTRVLVVAFNEGESVPTKAAKVEEMHYVPEFATTAKPVAAASVKSGKGGPGGAGDKKKGGGQKESPWGLSPEQKAAKKGAKAAKAKATPSA